MFVEPVVLLSKIKIINVFALILSTFKMVHVYVLMELFNIKENVFNVLYNIVNSALHKINVVNVLIT